MQKNFTSLSFMRVLKLEYPELLNSIMAIAEKHNPIALFLEFAMGRLVTKRPLLGQLEVDYRKEADTAVANELRSRREGIIKSVLLQKKSLRSSRIPSLMASAQLALPFLEKYFRNILSDSSKAQSRRINLMGNALDADAAMGEALVTVGMMVYIIELRAVQQELEVVEGRLVELKSARPRINTLAIKNEVTAELMNFFKAVDLAILEHPEVDYKPLLNEINQLLGEYRARLKARNTRRRNAAEDKQKGEAA